MLTYGGRPVYAEKIGLRFSQIHMERPPALVMQCIMWFTLAKSYQEPVGLKRDLCSSKIFQGHIKYIHFYKWGLLRHE